MTDHKDAKAEAKAAKARAKAMRPWFKKKRFILGGLLALLVIGAAAGGGGDTEDGTNLNASSDPTEAAPTPTEPASGDSAVRQGLGAKDASDDVELLGCRRDGVLGRTADIKVTNNSSKPSNYIIEVAFESEDGRTQFGTGNAFISALEPGQSKNEEVVSFDGGDDETPGKCRITEVQRNAA